MAVDELHFADGIDTPDRLAFGLGAAQLAVVVGGLLSAYSIARTSLPAAVTLPLALFVALLSAGLGWFKIAGRPSLEWAVFCARFVSRAREGSLLVVPERVAGSRIAPAVVADPELAAAAMSRRASSAVIVPLFDRAQPQPRPARRVVFFSLKGGVGRTSMCVELACWIAASGGHREPVSSARAPLRVALVDLDDRSPSVALRLGIPLPLPARADGLPAIDVRVVHRSGLHVIPAALSDGSEPIDEARACTLLAKLDADHFDVVVIDVGAAFSRASAAALQHADDIFVVLTPTVTGVHDAYRTTQALRRAGLRRGLSCVVNRARKEIDLSETIADLGLSLVAEIPDDPAMVDAENSHRQLSLDAGSATAAAIRSLGEYVVAHLDP